MKTTDEFDHKSFHERLTVYHAKGQFQAAYKWLKSLAELRPNDDVILFPLSRICIILRKYEEACEWAETAWNHCEKTAWDLRYYMAALVRVDDKSQQAIDCFDEFVARNDDENAPGLNDARLEKAYAYLNLGKYDLAIASAKEHIRGRRKGVFSFYLPCLAKDAIRDGEIAIREEEMYGKPQYSGDNAGWMTKSAGRRIERKVKIMWDSDDFAALRKYLRPIVKKYPQEYFFTIELSDTCIELELYDEALEHAQSAYNNEPSDPLALSQLIKALYYHRDYERVVEKTRELQKRGEFDIAYCLHGEGIQWARGLLADASFCCAASLLRLGRLQESQKEILIHENYRKRKAPTTITREAYLMVKNDPEKFVNLV